MNEKVERTEALGWKPGVMAAVRRERYNDIKVWSTPHAVEKIHKGNGNVIWENEQYTPSDGLTAYRVRSDPFSSYAILHIVTPEVEEQMQKDKWEFLAARTADSLRLMLKNHVVNDGPLALQLRPEVEQLLDAIHAKIRLDKKP